MDEGWIMEQGTGGKVYKPLRGSIRRNRFKHAKKGERREPQDPNNRPTRDRPVARKAGRVEPKLRPERKDKRYTYSDWLKEEGINATKRDSQDRARMKENAQLGARIRKDKEDDEKFRRRKPHGTQKINDLSANPPASRPEPMVVPRAGPAEDLEQAAAHRFAYTPEAYERRRADELHLGPPRNDWEARAGGTYNRNWNDTGRDQVWVNSTMGVGDRDYNVSVTGHEQAHGEWFDRGYETPEDQKEFMGAMRDWTADERGKRGHWVTDFMDKQVARPGGLYEGAGDERATEDYAYTVGSWPLDSAEDFPDYVKPYYSGFLKGADTSSTGEPIEPRQGRDSWMIPDENGLYGAVPPVGYR